MLCTKARSSGCSSAATSSGQRRPKDGEPGLGRPVRPAAPVTLGQHAPGGEVGHALPALPPRQPARAPVRNPASVASKIFAQRGPLHPAVASRSIRGSPAACAWAANSVSRLAPAPSAAPGEVGHREVEWVEEPAAGRKVRARLLWQLRGGGAARVQRVDQHEAAAHCRAASVASRRRSAKSPMPQLAARRVAYSCAVQPQLRPAGRGGTCRGRRSSGRRTSPVISQW